MVLNTEWSQVEVIDLINNGTGLAFGITGGRSTGVVVKTVLPGGVAYKDGRLQSGDHILQVGDINVRGLGSEHVASILRQCGVHVRLVVARPVEFSQVSFQVSEIPIVPTKLIDDPVELEVYLLKNGYERNIIYHHFSSSVQKRPYMFTDQQSTHKIENDGNQVKVSLDEKNKECKTCSKVGISKCCSDESSYSETETFEVELQKNDLGFGITVAGYVCEKEEISGVFVKSISKGSAADSTQNIKLNDRIVEVNGKSLVGLTNHEAVELLRKSGPLLKIKFQRYLRGPKYECLQKAIKADKIISPYNSSTTIISLPEVSLSMVQVDPSAYTIEEESGTSLDFDSTVLLEDTCLLNDEQEIIIGGDNGVIFDRYENNERCYQKWRNILTKKFELIVAQINKEQTSGLGISLEGTVDVENGKELRPHHYIRNILHDGPVDKTGIFKPGDELLEVNGVQLFGLHHQEVVATLKQLPNFVTMICARYATLSPVRKNVNLRYSAEISEKEEEDDNTSFEDFQECIEEFEECIDILNLCTEDDNSYNTSYTSAPEENDGNFDSDGENTLKSVHINNRDNSNLQNRKGTEIKPKYYRLNFNQISKLEKDLVNDSSTQSDLPCLSEKDDYETCVEESYSEDIATVNLIASSTDVLKINLVKLGTNVNKSLEHLFQLRANSSNRMKVHGAVSESSVNRCNPTDNNYKCQENSVVLYSQVHKHNKRSLSAPQILECCKGSEKYEVHRKMAVIRQASYNSDANRFRKNLQNCWGSEQTVQVYRKHNENLGINIVGGKVKLEISGNVVEDILGIFIKSILPDSPAGKTGELKPGDRILEVSGVNLKKASHEEAVQAIQNAENPVSFVIQPLLPLVSNHINSIKPVQIINENDQTENNLVLKEDHQENKIKPESESDDEDDEEDVRELEGRITTAKGFMIDRASAGNVKRTKEEILADSEEEDMFGYTTSKIKKKYFNLGQIVTVQLERHSQGLGISLAGHKDRNCMAVFVCGLNPKGMACKSGEINVGDELLEINGIVLHGRCHLNASSIIKGLAGPIFKIILLRRKSAVDDIAVKPVTQFPISVADEVSEEHLSANFPNVRTVAIKKHLNHSLGIMIIEGKHAEVGQGIFISDIQENSVAEEGGLQIGELILAVNKDSLIGSNYETAANLLKKADGLVTLIVSNPGKKEPTLPTNDASSLKPATGTKKEEGLKSSAPTSRATTPVVEPPPDPLSCPIIEGKEVSIELITDNKLLGIFFVGESDTDTTHGVAIIEVYPDGVAAKDKRLQTGDIILEVNGLSLRDVTYSTASQALRQALSKMKLIVYRPSKTEYLPVETNLFKKFGKGLGLSVVGKKTGTGVYVTEIISGGTADLDGVIKRGDIIMSVNEDNLENANGEEAGVILKIASGKIKIKVNRYKWPTR